MNIDYFFVHKFNLDYFFFAYVGGIFACVTAAHRPESRSVARQRPAVLTSDHFALIHMTLLRPLFLLQCRQRCQCLIFHIGIPEL